jgi:protein SCO1
MLLLGAWAVPAQSVKKTADLEKIDVVEHLGGQLPLDLPLRDEADQPITLGAAMGNDQRPVILTLAYYNCPMLCTLVLNAVIKGVNEQTLKPGQDFRLVTVSIDPRETGELAAAKRVTHEAAISAPGSWRFLTGSQESITTLAETVGFKYFHDEARDEFAHPAAIYIVTPDGRLSRYFYGIAVAGKDLRLSLVEASAGKIGTIVDRFIMYCYHYDPSSQGYVLGAMRVMRVGGILTLALLSTTLFFFWRHELRRRSVLTSATTSNPLL